MTSVRSKLVGIYREQHVEDRDVSQKHQKDNGGGVKLKVDRINLQRIDGTSVD